MQINSYMGYNRPSYLASTKTKSDASFLDLMQRTSVTVKKVPDSAGNMGNNGVRHARMCDEYRDWYCNREPINIPSADGWTEENIQYLKERYPDKMSIFERMEAMQIMENMGCITPEEHLEAVGTKLTVCDDGETVLITGRLKEDDYSRYPWFEVLSDADWRENEALKDFPIGKVKTLDELLDMLLAERKSGVFMK